MKFSIIVPVYDAEETIAQCLDALTNQDYPVEDYETVVVNDGSKDSTLEIVEQYRAKASNLRIINLHTNQGRIIAREVGARNAKYELLVFVDSRIIPESKLLQKIRQINYQPLNVTWQTYDKEYRSPYDCLFYLIRKRVYYPYFPVEQYLERHPGELYIDETNFDRISHGAGCFVCSRSLWLQAQPSGKGKVVSDDTRILANLVRLKKILKVSGIRVQYLQRTDFISVLKHIFEKGPRFADYHLVRGKRFYKYYLLAWFAISILVGIAIWNQSFLLCEAIVLLLGLMVLSAYLAEDVRGFFIVLFYFPPILVAFGLGILWGK